MRSRAVHHTAPTSEVRAVASTKASEASDNGSLWDHLLSSRDPLLRPWDNDVRGESSYWMPCWLPRRLPHWILLPFRQYLQFGRVLWWADAGGLQRLLLRAGKCLRAG